MRYDTKYQDDIKEVIRRIPHIELLYGKSVLITGANGMVCSPIVELLDYLNKKEGAKIKIYLAGRSEKRIASRFSSQHIEYSYVQYDATTVNKLAIDADYIIEGASNANPIKYAREPVETLLGNVLGLNSTLSMARCNGKGRIVYISSSEVYGKKDDNEPFKEDMYGFVDILSSRSCYPSGKRAAESLCASYYDEYGVESSIVRLGHIFGPSITKSDTRATAEFTRNAVNHEDIVMKSAGAQLRSYCYTLDCASAILSVLINGKPNQAYNISNRNSVISIREIAELFAKCSGVKLVFTNPTDEERRGFTTMQNSSLNSEKIEELGWKACFSTEEAVKRTIEILRLNCN